MTPMFAATDEKKYDVAQWDENMDCEGKTTKIGTCNLPGARIKKMKNKTGISEATKYPNPNDNV